MEKKMTGSEFRSLKRGDMVEIKHDLVWKLCRVQDLRYDEDAGAYIDYRVDGFTKSGHLRPLKRLWIQEWEKCRFPVKLPPASANVYADWLEDNGHYKAAAALRAAFPLSDGKEHP